MPLNMGRSQKLRCIGQRKASHDLICKFDSALDCAFDVLDAPRVFALTALANARSKTVMRRLGMKKVEGGDFVHPDFPAADPHAVHVLYVAERGARSPASA